MLYGYGVKSTSLNAAIIAQYHGSAFSLDAYAVGGVLPLLVLDFEHGYLSTPLSLTRASAGTYIDATGAIQTADADVARFDWSTGQRALMLEGSTTNFVTRSSHTDAFPWDAARTSNGITSTRVGSGTVGAVPYADYALTGTATAAAANLFVSPAYSLAATAVGQTWAASVYHQLVSGSWPSGPGISSGISEQNSGVYLTGGTGTPQVPGGAPNRTTLTRTLTNASTNQTLAPIQISGMTPGVTTFTGQVIRLFGWQLEQGGSPTSLIQTLGGVAAVRAADTATAALAAGTYDRRVIYSAGTADTLSVVHGSGNVTLPAGNLYRVAYYPEGALA